MKFADGAAVERKGVCQVCRRTLKNPKYVEIGIGPVCLRKRKAKLQAAAAALAETVA